MAKLMGQLQSSEHDNYTHFVRTWFLIIQYLEKLDILSSNTIRIVFLLSIWYYHVVWWFVYLVISSCYCFLPLIMHTLVLVNLFISSFYEKEKNNKMCFLKKEKKKKKKGTIRNFRAAPDIFIHRTKNTSVLQWFSLRVSMLWKPGTNSHLVVQLNIWL